MTRPLPRPSTTAFGPALNGGRRAPRAVAYRPTMVPNTVERGGALVVESVTVAWSLALTVGEYATLRTASLDPDARVWVGPGGGGNGGQRERLIDWGLVVRAPIGPGGRQSYYLTDLGRMTVIYNEGRPDARTARTA